MIPESCNHFAIHPVDSARTANEFTYYLNNPQVARAAAEGDATIDQRRQRSTKQQSTKAQKKTPCLERALPGYFRFVVDGVLSSTMEPVGLVVVGPIVLLLCNLRSQTVTCLPDQVSFNDFIALHLKTHRGRHCRWVSNVNFGNRHHSC